MAIRYLSGINVDSNTLFVDSTNNRVGIGTDAPQRPLHVNGTEGVLRLTSTASGNDGFEVGIGTSSQAFLWQSENSHIEIATNNTERMRITSGGSVLIATSTNPYTLGSLVVSHDSTLTRTYFQRGVELIEIAPSDGTGPNTISSSYTPSGSAYKPLSLSGRQNSADLYLATSGNVLIGTTTDAGHKLDVNGVGRFSSGVQVPNGQYFQTIRNSGGLLINLLGIDAGTDNTRLLITGDFDIRNGSLTSLMNMTAAGTTTFSASQLIIANANASVYFTTGSADYGNGSAIGRASTNGFHIGGSIAGDLCIGAEYGKGIIFGTGASGTLTQRMKIDTTGSIRFNSYGSGSFTGTATYGLAVDSSGNIIEVTSTLDGSGTANYVTKWADSNTLTDSIIYDNGTSVGVGTTTPNPFSWATKTITVVSSASNSYAALEAYGNGTGAGALLLGNTSILRASIVAEDGSNLLFATNAGNTGSSQSERMRITAAGNVGIGTTAPGFKLTVVGGNGNQLGLDNSGERFTQLSFLESGSQNSAIWLDGTDNMFDIYANTGHGIRLKTGGDNPRLTVTSDGNVGIGTTNPGERLHVVGPSNNWAAHFVSGTSESYFSYGAGYGAYINAGSSASSSTYILELISNSSTRMFVRGDGNVGIGTTSPGTLLHLVQSSGPTIRLVRTSNRFDITADNDFMELNARDASTYMIFKTADTERMRITAGGSLLIGSTTQGYNPQTQGYLLGVKSDTTQAFISIAKSGQTLDSEGMIVGLDSTTGYVWMRQNVDLTFGTNNTTKVTIAAGGNVGIGTTAPSQKLEIYGARVAITDTSNDTAGYYARVLSGGTQVGNFTLRANNDGSTYLYNGTTSDSIKQVWLTNGNVGIGTTSPSAKLEVNAGTTANFSFQVDANSTFAFGSTNGTRLAYLRNPTVDDNGLQFGTDTVDSTGIIAGAATSAGTGIDFYTYNGSAWGNRVRITKTGNVGIGTTSPAAYSKLQVKVGTDYNLAIGQDSGALGIGAYNDAVNATANLNITGTVISFSSGGERMRITSGGNVLIGTTTDGGYKLRVNGTGRYDDYLQLWSGTAGASPRLIFGGETTQTDKSIFLESYYMVFQGHNNEGFKFQTTSSLGAVSNRMSILGNGTVVLSNYGSGSKTGTVAYNLAVDASGNVIETAGGVVDGSGTANYVTKWQDANTVTNSSITDDGTTVTATATNFVSQSNLGTAYTSFTTSGTTAIFDTITRTGAAIYQIVIVANPNSAGSGAYADFYYGKVFIGTGYNGSAVVDVINYHQESPMPRGLYGSGGGDLTVTAVMLVGGSEVTEVAANTSYTIRIKIAGYVVAGSNTTVRLQRIM